MLDDFAKRIAWAIDTIKDDRDLDKGITDVDLSKILGTNKNTLAGYRRGEGFLKGEVIERLVEHYRFSPQWLFKGEGEPFPGARAKYPEVCGPEEPLPKSTQADLSDDFVFIKQVSGCISAGGGLMPDNSVDVQCAFRRDWIKRRGGKPENMSLIKVSGDSMEPTLLSGDLVLVDHAKTTVAPQGGIYAISIDQEIMIKRVQVLFNEGKLRIISDNKQYDPIEATPDQVRINGKVIWFGRELER
ncbi:MAG: S24 family peptidase [Syntrophales bacterium]|jgi:phage repressor protein C with HTH and peptisase S24 domain|nr:S24 family peptidase [Syntrophales bacterium]